MKELTKKQQSLLNYKEYVQHMGSIDRKILSYDGFVSRIRNGKSIYDKIERKTPLKWLDYFNELHWIVFCQAN